MAGQLAPDQEAEALSTHAVGALLQCKGWGPARGRHYTTDSSPALKRKLVTLRLLRSTPWANQLKTTHQDNEQKPPNSKSGETQLKLHNKSLPCTHSFTCSAYVCWPDCLVASETKALNTITSGAQAGEGTIQYKPTLRPSNVV